MLVHLSNTSPYVCDLNRGPIEEANRMASAPTRNATALLEQKPTRTPLKLLGLEEVPMDTTTTDINASLQPVWYTEQTINDVQQEDIASIIQEQQGKSPVHRITLPPIPSESPSIPEEIEELPNQPSLMHKSSTFTIEPSINVDSPLNDSEKENTIKEDATDQIIPPSDDSFRALEQLLGLGSGATVRESPKNNHDTLSLTVVTPTDIVNATRRSSRISYVQKGGSDSLPSSQDIPTMPTIESITSTNPPSFLMDNTAMDEEQPSTTNQQTSFDITDNDTIKDDSNNDDETNFSFELNDFPNNSNNEPNVVAPQLAQPMITIRAPTCADVAYRALIKPRTGGRVSQPIKADSPLAKPIKVRSSAPSSRALRSSGVGISAETPSENSVIQQQPAQTLLECSMADTNTNTELVEIITLPEEDETEQEKTSSVTLDITATKDSEGLNQNTPDESTQMITPPKPIIPVLSREYTYNTPTRRPSNRRRSALNSFYTTPIQQQQQTTINEEEMSSPSVTSNSMLDVLLTKPTEAQPEVIQTIPIVSSPVRVSERKTMNQSARDSPSVASKSMLDILLTKPTEAEAKMSGKTSSVPSPVRASKRKTINSPSVASKSMLEVLLTKPTTTVPTIKQNTSIVPSPVRTSRRKTTNSPSIASKSMLGVLLTNPAETESSVTPKKSVVPSPVRISKRNTMKQQTTASPSLASKSMLGILLTNPTEDELNVTPQTSIASSSVLVSTGKSERSSSHPTPRASINPLHSSTPSRHKPLQMVSIGEQEQVLTIVPQPINIEIHQEQQDIETSIQQPATIEIGVQTTPSLNLSSRRRLNTSQQQTTPIAIVDEQQITPVQTKMIMNIQRSVRFQLTPVTDARLVAKEEIEETLRGSKPDIVIHPTPVVSETKPEKVKSIPIKKALKPKKKVITSKKKKAASRTRKTESKAQPTKKKSRSPRKPKPTPSTKDSKKQTESSFATKQVGRKRTSPEVKPKPATKRASSKTTTNAISKRAAAKATSKAVAKRSARKRVIPAAAIESIVAHASTKRTPVVTAIAPAGKRSGRKATIPKAKTQPIVDKQPVLSKRATPEPVAKRTSMKRPNPETTIEPVTKRVKTTKSVEVKKQPTKVSLPPMDLPKTRSGLTNNKKNIPAPAAPIKTSKRRLPSVEKTEQIKKKVDEKPAVSVQNVELNQEERQKIEALTVAELKSRLNTHKIDIPKGAKKAALIALLIKNETNLLKTRNETATTTTAAKTTRLRRKN